MSWRHDAAGRIPEVADYVVYNRGGDLATGWIKSVGRSRSHPVYTIECHRPPVHEGKTSRVRGGAQCVLVLERAGLPVLYPTPKDRP